MGQRSEKSNVDIANILKNLSKGESVCLSGNYRYNEMKSNRAKYIKVSEFIKR